MSKEPCMTLCINIANPSSNPFHNKKVLLPRKQITWKCHNVPEKKERKKKKSVHENRYILRMAKQKKNNLSSQLSQLNQVEREGFLKNKIQAEIW